MLRVIWIKRNMSQKSWELKIVGITGKDYRDKMLGLGVIGFKV